MKLSYAVIETKMGWLGLLGSMNGLRHIVLPQDSPQAVLCMFGERLFGATSDVSFFGDLPNRLSRYFDNKVITFNDNLDFTGATPFQFTVWQTVRSIPYGQTRSYAEVAKQIGLPQGAQAVGQALAKNPLPIMVPCHRVISTGGRLGGFSYGLEMKGRLLQLEADLMKES